MKKKNQLFYCYSPILRKYLEELEIKEIKSGFNKKSNSKFWVYRQTLTLGIALKAYKTSKELFTEN